MLKRQSFSPKSARSFELSSGKKRLITPTFFPAISGSQHNFQPTELVDLITRNSYPRMLISAYDFSGKGQDGGRNIAEISEYFRNGSFVMLDSGIFESSWSRDEKWSFKKYAQTARSVDSDFYFAYDLPAKMKATDDGFARASLWMVRKSYKIGIDSHCIPIVHGANPKQLIYVASRVADSLADDTCIIAVPERECGSTILERARTILQLTNLLGGKRDRLLHILGCGDPVSMALYSYCGADTFDSLDWTSQIIDRVSLRFRGIAHIDLISCKCNVCKRPFENQMRRALLHNLLFYQDFALQLQSMIKRNTLADFLIEFVGKSSLGKI